MFLSLNLQTIFFITRIKKFRTEFPAAKSILIKIGFGQKTTTALSLLPPEIRKKQVGYSTYYSWISSATTIIKPMFSGRESIFWILRLCRQHQFFLMSASIFLMPESIFGNTLPPASIFFDSSIKN